MTPEDGTGLSGSDSYVSLAQADAYAAARGWTDWTGSNAHKEQRLVQATAYIDATYRFRGVISKTTQALAWPRLDDTGEFLTDGEGRPLTGVPKAVQGACIELARVAITQALTPAPEAPAVKRERVKAGSVETETEYAVAAGSTADAIPSIMADRLLAPLVRSSAATGIGGGFAAFVPG